MQERNEISMAYESKKDGPTEAPNMLRRVGINDSAAVK
jgi:hypothetical protein